MIEEQFGRLITIKIDKKEVNKALNAVQQLSGSGEDKIVVLSFSPTVLTVFVPDRSIDTFYALIS